MLISQPIRSTFERSLKGADKTRRLSRQESSCDRYKNESDQYRRFRPHPGGNSGSFRVCGFDDVGEVDFLDRHPLTQHRRNPS